MTQSSVFGILQTSCTLNGYGNPRGLGYLNESRQLLRLSEDPDGGVHSGRKVLGIQSVLSRRTWERISRRCFSNPLDGECLGGARVAVDLAFFEQAQHALAELHRVVFWQDDRTVPTRIDLAGKVKNERTANSDRR
jgi:hypothetical protein